MNHYSISPFRKGFYLVVCFLALLGAGPAHAPRDDLDDSNRVEFFAPTNKLNPADGRLDALRVEFGEVDVNDVGAFLNHMKPVLPPVDPKHPPVVPYYMSRNRTKEERESRIAAAEAQFQKAFPGVKPVIEVIYLDDTELELKKVAADRDAAIDKAAQSLPPGAQTDASIHALHEANKKALADALEEQKKETFWQKMGKPKFTKRFIEADAHAKAMLGVVVHGAKAVVSGAKGGPLGILAGLTLMDYFYVYSYYNAKYTVQANNALANHPLPYHGKRPWLKHLADFYTNSQYAKILKFTVGGAAIWGTLNNALVQHLGHLNNPLAIHAVKLSDVGKYFGVGVVSYGLQSGAVVGFENLRQKGWIRQRTVELAVRGENLLSITGSLMLTGSPHFQAAAPLVLGPMWASFVAAWVAGATMRPKNDRFVFVDPLVENRHEINDREALDSTHVVRAPSMASVDETVHGMEDLKNVPLHNWFYEQGCKALDFLGRGHGPSSARPAQATPSTP